MYTCIFMSSNSNIIEIFRSHSHFLYNNCLSLNSPHLTCIFCTEMLIKMLSSKITFTSQRTIFSCTFSDVGYRRTPLDGGLSCYITENKGNNKITELRTILQRESQNSEVYKQTKSVNNRKTVKTVMTLTWYRHF